MTEWDVWVRDTRHKPLTRVDAKRLVSAAFASAEVELTAGPIVLVPPERHRGQWIFRVRFGYRITQEWVWMRTTEALDGTQFEMRGKPLLHRQAPKLRSFRGGR